jgi:hypothetical protein
MKKTKKKKTKKIAKPEAMIEAVIKPLRDAVYEQLVSSYTGFVAQTRDLLADAGGDFDKVWPRATRGHREDYRRADSIREGRMPWCELDVDATTKAEDDFNAQSDLIKENWRRDNKIATGMFEWHPSYGRYAIKADVVEIIKKLSSREADAIVYGYALKLTEKKRAVTRSKTVCVSYDGTRNPWDMSTITITTNNGKAVIFNTKMIMNFSVYGKPFNQFPTRLVSHELVETVERIHSPKEVV